MARSLLPLPLGVRWLLALRAFLAGSRAAWGAGSPHLALARGSVKPRGWQPPALRVPLGTRWQPGWEAAHTPPVVLGARVRVPRLRGEAATRFAARSSGSREGRPAWSGACSLVPVEHDWVGRLGSHIDSKRSLSREAAPRSRIPCSEVQAALPSRRRPRLCRLRCPGVEGRVEQGSIVPDLFFGARSVSEVMQCREANRAWIGATVLRKDQRFSEQLRRGSHGAKGGPRTRRKLDSE